MKTILATCLLLSTISSYAQQSAVTDACAVVYNSQDTNVSSELSVRNGDRIHNLNRVPLSRGGGDWDNKITAMYVKQGCSLTGYQYQNFNIDLRTGQALQGFAQVFENTAVPGYGYFVLDEYTNNKISSLKCTCP